MATLHHQDQLDMDLMAETELTRLQRQYRIMEGDRRAFLDDITSKLTLQRHLLSQLRTQKSNLLTNLRPTTCQTQRNRNATTSNLISRLLHRHQTATAALHRQADLLAELQAQIARYERFTGSHLKPQAVSRAVTASVTLENRLETSKTRFGSLLAGNRRTRAEIDHLLAERARSAAILRGMAARLAAGKRLLLETVDAAGAAFDRREDSGAKRRALAGRQEGDAHAHAAEMRALRRRLAAAGALRAFLATKGRRRVMRDREAAEARRRELAAAEREAHFGRLRAQLAAVRRFCGEEEVGRVCGRYAKREEGNFALFNYVNELGQEVEALRAGIARVEVGIGELEARGRERALREVMTLEALALRLEAQKAATCNDEREVNEVEGKMAEVLDGINELFVMCDGGKAPILNLLGFEVTINADNVFVYLGLLEKRILEVVTSCYFKEKSLVKRKNKG